MEARSIITGMTATLVLDRILKLAAQKGLLEEWSFFGFPFPRFMLHENCGAAFDLPVPRGITIGISAVLIIIIFIFLARAWNVDLSRRSGLILLLAGALSNFYDRVRFGCVIDVIEAVPGSIWNIADVLIIAGIVILLFSKKARGTKSNVQNPDD